MSESTNEVSIDQGTNSILWKPTGQLQSMNGAFILSFHVPETLFDIRFPIYLKRVVIDFTGSSYPGVGSSFPLVSSITISKNTLSSIYGYKNFSSYCGYEGKGPCPLPGYESLALSHNMIISSTADLILIVIQSTFPVQYINVNTVTFYFESLYPPGPGPRPFPPGPRPFPPFPPGPGPRPFPPGPGPRPFPPFPPGPGPLPPMPPVRPEEEDITKQWIFWVLLIILFAELVIIMIILIVQNKKKNKIIAINYRTP